VGINEEEPTMVQGPLYFEAQLARECQIVAPAVPQQEIQGRRTENLHNGTMPIQNMAGA